MRSEIHGSSFETRDAALNIQAFNFINKDHFGEFAEKLAGERSNGKYLPLALAEFKIPCLSGEFYFVRHVVDLR